MALLDFLAPGASLLGSLFSKPKPKYVVPDYAGIRKGAEAAGFNPLTALTQGPQGSVVDMAGGMGSAIADAGLMLADNLAKSKRSGMLSQVQSENAQLRDKVTSLTLRPKVGGVYSQRQSVPSVPSALGVKGSISGAVGTQVSSLVSENSYLAGAIVGPDDGNLTGPQLAVAKGVPAFRFAGHDFYGSGLFSTGQQIEDAVGESELVSTVYAPVVLLDAAVNEANKTYQHYLGQPFANAVDRAWAGLSAVKPKGQVKPGPVYSGRGERGMPRRRLTAMGWQPY